jgi:Na+/H+-dicarboxylate symporter
MWSLFNLIALFFTTGEGIREDQRQGLWSWSKFLFALAFGALESALVILPIALSSHYPDRYFLRAYLAAMVLALANFGWFIPVMRRWKLPNAAATNPNT